MRTCFLLLLFPVFLLAQSNDHTYISIGVVQSTTGLRALERFQVTTDEGTFSSQAGHLRTASFSGLSLGISHAFRPCWEFAYRLNFGGATVTEDIGPFDFSTYGFEHLQTRERTFRTTWSDAVVLWRITGKRSRTDVQIGTGLFWLEAKQYYNAGFAMQQDGSITDRFRQEEEVKDIGVPLHFQIQHPITDRFKIGTSLQLNTSFTGRSKQANLSAYVAYGF